MSDNSSKVRAKRSLITCNSLSEWIESPLESDVRDLPNTYADAPLTGMAGWLKESESGNGIITKLQNRAQIRLKLERTLKLK